MVAPNEPPLVIVEGRPTTGQSNVVGRLSTAKGTTLVIHHNWLTKCYNEGWLTTRNKVKMKAQVVQPSEDLGQTDQNMQDW